MQLNSLCPQFGIVCCSSEPQKLKAEVCQCREVTWCVPTFQSRYTIPTYRDLYPRRIDLWVFVNMITNQDGMKNKNDLWLYLPFSFLFLTFAKNVKGNRFPHPVSELIIRPSTNNNKLHLYPHTSHSHWHPLGIYYCDTIQPLQPPTSSTTKVEFEGIKRPWIFCSPAHVIQKINIII